MQISICIATYRRPDRLRSLLEDLLRQEYRPSEIIVVDNDAVGSAGPVVQATLDAGASIPIHYAIQPARNIALTRNRTVEMAGGDWIAFIDDDERAPTAWLKQLVEAAMAHAADGVLGPVVPEVPSSAPAWIRRGRFYDFPRLATGEVVPLNRMRFGNVILRGDPLRALPGPFDVNYGLVTGEDADLLIRMVQKGARVVWCDEAVVIEPVEPARLSLKWLLQRAVSGGQEFARKTVAGRYGPISATGRLSLIVRSLAQLGVSALLALVSWPLGRQHAAKWLVKASANLGKLSIFWGWRYSEYA